MNITKLNDYPKGWFVGHFKEAILPCSAAEVAVKSYKAGDTEVRHYHKEAVEVSVIVSGKMQMNDTVVVAGDVVVVQPFEVITFSCLEDGNTVVVKTPSVPGDKYLC